MPQHRSPRELWRQSLHWVKETGWPTYAEDKAVADQVYTAWVIATNAEWLATSYRDRGKLSDALEAAFRPIRSDRAADCLYALFMVLLEIRGRREGILQRDRHH